jgi:hypothetical protein
MVKLTVLEFGGRRAKSGLVRPRSANPAITAAQQPDKQDK